MTDDIGAQIAELTRAIQALNADRLSEKARLSNTRAPSMARALGVPPDGGPSFRPSDGWPALKASLGADYVPGTLIRALADAGDRDADRQSAGKAVLQGLGLRYLDAPENTSKATLGTTGASGGYVLPNNVVDTVAKPAVGAIDWLSVLKVRDGVAVRGVDQPFRTGAPARMTAQDWGTTKSNADEAYGSYTASLATFARILDISKQYLRFSAGAAEADVMDELAKAYQLTIEYEVLAGPGTGSVGSGDACNGIVTALLATPTWLGYRGAKTNAAASNTILGAFASALSEMFSLMATRARFPSVVVVDSLTYWAALSQGSDTAGFWLDPKATGGFTIDATGGLSYWGVPVRHSPNFNSFTGATKAALAIDGPAFKLYRGMEFRIDTSDQAGTRWDQNLQGYRGEAELGINADTGVHVGAAQYMTAVIP